jgi:hypothetical protein
MTGLEKHTKCDHAAHLRGPYFSPLNDLKAHLHRPVGKVCGMMASPPQWDSRSRIRLRGSNGHKPPVGQVLVASLGMQLKEAKLLELWDLISMATIQSMYGRFGGTYDDWGHGFHLGKSLVDPFANNSHGGLRAKKGVADIYYSSSSH